MNFSIMATGAAAMLSAISVGGSFYESLVVDSAWPQNPTLIQPKEGGLRRVRFWIPAHVSLEIILIISICFNWTFREVRLLLFLALACHGVMRVWSFVDLIPRALAFERMDASSISGQAAKAWTSRSLVRLPLAVAAALLTLAALVVTSGHLCHSADGPPSPG
jgi:hypothetical protein